MNQPNNPKSQDSQQPQHEDDPQINLQQHQDLMYHIQEYQMLNSAFHHNENPNMINSGFYPGDIPNEHMQHLDIHSHSMMPLVDYSTPASIISLENAYNSPLISHTPPNLDAQRSYSLSFQQQNIQNPPSIVSSQSPFHVEQDLERRTSRQEQEVFTQLISMARSKNANIQQRIPSTSDNIRQFQDYLNTKASFKITLNTQALERKKDQTRSSASSDEKQDIPVYSLKSKSNLIYELKIVQQPERGRMFGFGNKDRRPISPPPILQLIVKTNDGRTVDPETFDVSFLVVVCDVCPPDETKREQPDPNVTLKVPSSHFTKFSATEDDEQGMASSSAPLRSLAGSLATSASKLYDLDGNLGIFFVFQDISLRTEGKYKLSFMLIDIESPDFHIVNTTSKSKVLETVESDFVTIYSIKKFPGVAQTTPLSLCFARQGIKLPTRRIPKETTTTQPPEEDDEEYEEY